MESLAQFGEDLLIHAELERIGVRNQWCFEVGAHDGTFASNTLLFRNMGWNAVLMERDPVLFATMEETYGAIDGTQCYNATVKNLDSMLELTGAPKDIDFGVIDIDGADYWLWSDMEVYRPRLMLIEFSPYKHQEGYIEHDPQPRGSTVQTARLPTIELGTDKGYRLVGETFCNLLFVDEYER